MSNRTQGGYAAEQGATAANGVARLDAVRLHHETPAKPSPVGRAALTDAGDFDRPYEQWSLGDLENRAVLLGLSNIAPMKERLIGEIRRAECTDAVSEQRPMEQWTKTDLYNRARELGIPGRSAMTRRRLINAVRRVEGAGA